MFDGDQVVVSWNAAYVSSFCNLFMVIMIMILLMMMIMVIVALKIDNEYSDYDGTSCENYDE